MLTQIELDQLAVYMTEVIECDPDYEEDCFAFTFGGVRIYAERYRSHYMLELGHEDNRVDLPR